MKAQEYADQFRETMLASDVQEACNVLITGILKEGADIMEQRKIKKDSGALAVLREQNLKYKAVCRRVNKNVPLLNETGYEQLIFHRMGIMI